MGESEQPGDSARARALAALRDVPVAELLERRAELQDAARAAGVSAEEIVATLNGRKENPRALAESERRTLCALLDHADFPGRDALRAQVPHARVVGYCPCGCATVKLAVNPQMAAPADVTSRVPGNELRVFDEGGTEAGGVILFVDDGYLSQLEIHTWFDPICPFPPSELLIPAVSAPMNSGSLVRLTRDIPEHGLAAGTEAKVQEERDPESDTYAVRVVDGRNRTLFYGSLPGDLLEPALGS